MSVSEIGKKVGYSDKRMFLAAFKKTQSASPAEYRNKNRSFRFALYRDYAAPQYTLDVDTDATET